MQVKQYDNNRYDSSGAYRLKSIDCPLQYIGQTRHPSERRFNEHIHAMKYNKDTATYAQHIINMGHTYGEYTGYIGNTSRLVIT